ncbi:helix-turn-helix transcriptional regulator [Xylanimonas sp. McL0601]|uniref:helix-turn-helix transcriptional regulator n=1 Tax=Xylanimonas sp. McL0601 TaxID=3414739 RepID=UPI003CF98B54
MGTTARPRAGDAAPGDSSASRAALLTTLRAASQPLTVQELAAALGLHQNSVRFHLARLVRHGLVTERQASPTGPGRPSLVYTAVDSTTATRPSGFQLLASALSEHIVRAFPEPSELALEAGREQGRTMVSRDPGAPPAGAEEGKQLLTALMRDQGFDPEWDADDRRLWLRTCPFRPVSDEQPDIVCRLHLGLMRGALDAAGAPLEVTSLDRAPAPHPCLAVVQPQR